MKKLEVIGLSGKIGTGKDYLAREYFRPLGYFNFSLAWHFKVWLAGKGDATHEEIFVTKPPKVRDLLQKEGTERGRLVYGEDVWVITMFEWMNLLNEAWGVNKYIIPDVRFKNEVKAIQERGGRVFRISAPKRDANSGASKEARAHISETDLDDFPLDKFDGLLFNDPEYTSTMSMQIRTLLGLSPIATPRPMTLELEDFIEGEIPGADNIMDRINEEFDKMGELIDNLFETITLRKHD